MRFAIAGCGGIGRLHAQVLERVPGARLVAVADVDPARAAGLAASTGARAMDLGAVMAATDVDAVRVCVPSGLHAAVGVRAAAGGKHVLVEKPIDVTLEAADALIHACEDAGVTLGVVAQRRYDPSMIRLRGAVEAGELGRIHHATAVVRWWRDQAYYDDSGWRGSRRLDGGALLNQGVHSVDLLLWLLGPARSVYARLARAAHAIECEDLAVLTVEMESGALATIEVTTAAYPGFTERHTLTGANGTVAVEGTEVEVWGLRDAPVTTRDRALPVPGAGSDPGHLALASHQAQMERFIDSCRRGATPAESGADGRRALQLILAAHQSDRIGRPVSLAGPAPAAS